MYPAVPVLVKPQRDLEGLLHIPGASMKGRLFIPANFERVEALKIGSVGASFGEVTMLVR